MARNPAQGERTVFENKKLHSVNEDDLLRHLTDARRISKEMDVGQREATITLKPQHPHLPAYFWLLCDSHLGNVQVDYDAFSQDYRIVRDTPNFYALANGDEIDNFMVHTGRAAVGVYENPISPEQQALLMRGLFKTLDDKGKMAAFSFGNHNEWSKGSGYKFENTWLRDFRCPILNCGGLVEVKLGNQTYRIAMTHRYWGNSRKNPTNAAKNYLDFEYKDADVVFLGHTHVAEYLFFRRGHGNPYKFAVIGGTYKLEDEFAAQNGYGSGGQKGGFVLALHPDRWDMEIIGSVEKAKKRFTSTLP